MMTVMMNSPGWDDDVDDKPVGMVAMWTGWGWESNTGMM